jgi:penicillin-binding protein 1A
LEDAAVRLSNRLVSVLVWVSAALAVFYVLSISLAIYLYNVSLSLPDLGVNPDAVHTARTSVVYAADGQVIAEWHGEQDRTVVALKDIPDYMVDAVVAIEDRRFYQHDGVDIEAVTRALGANASAGEVEQGGSTITQQLVKILFTGSERSLARKLKEALFAFELESKNDKDAVLGAYLNTVYFGRGAYGVESAAQRYFGKPAAKLDLGEAATLAGIIRSPSRYGSTASVEETQKRRDTVLAAMVEQGMITDTQETEAQKQPLTFTASKEAGQVAPYFVEYVKQDLIDTLGAEKVYAGGLRVYTSLSPQLQAEAELATQQLSLPGDPEVALVTVRPSDGQVLAMVGGRDFKANQFNLAAQGKRQPGSAFKPFVLVTALENGVKADDVFDARPYSVRVTDGVWSVQNYENGFTADSMTLRAATDYSVNAVYARLIMQLGPAKVVKTAQRMGITTPLDPNPAIALGGLKYGVSPLEMASAYATIANGGVRVPPSGIVKVTDDAGRVVLSRSAESTRVLEPAIAEQAAAMLHEVVEKGTADKAKLPVWAAGKTGTTQSYRDAWFVGWADGLSTAVWVGDRTGQVPMTNVHGLAVTGGTFPAMIWRQYTQAALNSVVPVAGTGGSVPGQPPPILVECTVCDDTKLLANPRCPHKVQLYVPSESAPRETCTQH